MACAALAAPVFGSDRYPAERPGRSVPAETESDFVIHPDRPRQVISGLGFEIQSDSIASNNAGLPEATIGVPHDLVPAERQRLAAEMLHGFRYCRIAGGLYWRGLDSAQKQLEPRWPEQLVELRDMIRAAGVEGVSLEYWSPAPFWKANRKYPGNDGTPNVLRCFGPDFANDPVYHGDVDRFLKDFADACRGDLATLKAAGIPVVWWNLQNEPMANTTYSSCIYSPADYTRAFLAVAPVIRAYDPHIRILADTGPSWDFPYVRPVLQNPATAGLVDALAIHHIGSNANVVLHPPAEPSGKPRFQNEYEYQPYQGPATPDKCLNTVEHVMNWLQIAQAPTWYWIHALKPYTNEEASGYSLGFWRPSTAMDPSKFPKGLQPGHWTWNPYNWYAVGSFVRHLPWDSRGVAVDEAKQDEDLRILAYLRPDGKLVVAVANRCHAAHTFHLHTGLTSATFTGWRYTPSQAGEDCRGLPSGTSSGPDITTLLPDLAWEFWEQR